MGLNLQFDYRDWLLFTGILSVSLGITILSSCMAHTDSTIRIGKSVTVTNYVTMTNWVTNYAR